MIKLIHAADLHLDAAFSALTPEQAAQCRREQRQALLELAELCRGCDLLLLSGDLFDSARVYRDTLEALHRLFDSIEAEVFIAPGNHDHLASGSPYLTEKWGNNVHIFTSSEIACIHLKQCDVYGAAFTGQEMPDLMRGFRAADPNVCNLMVLHADVATDSKYCPIREDEIAASGLDYLALGHVHTASVRQAGHTVYAYPGCLMGRGFDECGAKGVLSVTLDGAECRAKFVPLSCRRYEVLSVAAGDDPLAAIRAALPDGHERACCRIDLIGEASDIDTAALEEALRGDFFSLSVRDRTVPKQALWDGMGDDTLRGLALQTLHDCCQQTDDAVQRAVIVQAARLVAALTDGREVVL